MNSNFFTIWVESQEYAEPCEYEDFLNVVVTFSSGLSIGLNVWSYKFYASQMSCLRDSDIEEEYMIPPDLVLKDMSESAIRRVISRLIVEEKWPQGISIGAPDD